MKESEMRYIVRYDSSLYISDDGLYIGAYSGHGFDVSHPEIDPPERLYYCASESEFKDLMT